MIRLAFLDGKHCCDTKFLLPGRSDGTDEPTTPSAMEQWRMLVGGAAAIDEKIVMGLQCNFLLPICLDREE
jgi:hypothetical protein